MNAAARTSIIGAGLGAGLIFLLDPAHGHRRRALIRDQVVNAGRKSYDAAGTTGRRLRMRARGGSLLSRAPADDAVMVERVRVKLGRLASHPRAIEVHACNGCITLTGDVLATEVASIMNTLAGMRGVVDVENQMTTHAPSLQGRTDRPGTSSASTWLKSGWSPAAMVVCGLTTAVAIGGTVMMLGRRG